MFELRRLPQTDLTPETEREFLPHYDAELRFWTTFEYFWLLARGRENLRRQKGRGRMVT